MHDRKLVSQLDLSQVADSMAATQPGSQNDQVAKAEFLFRQTQFVERQAKAAEETAAATKRYTRYMLWSVVILAASSVLTAVVTLVTK
jgi:thiaminase